MKKNLDFVDTAEILAKNLKIFGYYINCEQHTGYVIIVNIENPSCCKQKILIMEEYQMKIKKLLAALAASALALSLAGMAVFAAPIDGEDEIIPDDDIIFDEPFVEEDPFDWPVEPEWEPEPEPIPAPPVVNPPTGNPSVAMAAIPVALAAAAVVTKKIKK